MSIACLLLGTNIGDRLHHLASARNLITRAGTIERVSAVYRTAPWGVENQPEFYNQAVVLNTNLTPFDLLKYLKASEKDLGRMEGEPWSPRIIDLDILFMDGLILKNETLEIPHPRVRERRFALVPLMEIAPGFIDPVTGLSVAGLLEQCPDMLGVHRL